MALSVSFCPGSSCCSAEPTPSHAVRLSLVYGDVVAVVVVVVVVVAVVVVGWGGWWRWWLLAVVVVGR